MNPFAIQRVAVRPEGAFGVLLHKGLPVAVTLERTFPSGQADGDGSEVPVIPFGEWRCVRTVYYKGGYPTYEVLVPGHSRLLFHAGNAEHDSEGCVLVGRRFDSERPAILDSVLGLGDFLRHAGSLAEFWLDVKDPA